MQQRPEPTHDVECAVCHRDRVRPLGNSRLAHGPSLRIPWQGRPGTLPTLWETKAHGAGKIPGAARGQVVKRRPSGPAVTVQVSSAMLTSAVTTRTVSD
ncbi:hypothetical protein GCM10010377_52150 [Streptomyces viridiviolaceus]|nr:hypothetical protein GCM10010377_52150 [Streptomyces viridiviolaceus]